MHRFAHKMGPFFWQRSVKKGYFLKIFEYGSSSYEVTPARPHYLQMLMSKQTVVFLCDNQLGILTYILQVMTATFSGSNKKLKYISISAVVIVALIVLGFGFGFYFHTKATENITKVSLYMYIYF